MAKSNHRIVLMGRSKRETAPAILEVLAHIAPDQVPHNMLDGVFVTLADASKYQIDKAHLKNGINYDTIVGHIKAAGATAEIELIEVVVDVDYIDRLLNKQMHNILDPFFA